MKPRIRWCVAAGLLLTLGSVQAQGHTTRQATKFGTLSVAADKSLHFNGKPVKPDVVGRAGLAIEQMWDMGEQAWVLVANLERGECPEVLHIITLSARGASASPTLGTCDANKDVRMVNGSLIVEVEGDGAISSHKYVYAQGTLTDNGRVVHHGLNLQAMINDPDGYTNVRQGPDAKSPIVARVNQGEAFATNPQRGNWWKVRLSNHQEGYMHQSRIVLVRDY